MKSAVLNIEQGGVLTRAGNPVPTKPPEAAEMKAFTTELTGGQCFFCRKKLIAKQPGGLDVKHEDGTKYCGAGPT